MGDPKFRAHCGAVFYRSTLCYLMGCHYRYHIKTIIMIISSILSQYYLTRIEKILPLSNAATWILRWQLTAHGKAFLAYNNPLSLSVCLTCSESSSMNGSSAGCRRGAVSQLNPVAASGTVNKNSFRDDCCWDQVCFFDLPSLRHSTPCVLLCLLLF